MVDHEEADRKAHLEVDGQTFTGCMPVYKLT